MNPSTDTKTLTRRREIEQALLLDVADGKLDRARLNSEKRKRFSQAGVSYTPAEYPLVEKDIRDRIESAAINNKIEGYVLDKEQVEKLIQAEIDGVLGAGY